MEGIEDLADGEFELRVDGEPVTFRFAGGRLHQRPGPAEQPELVVRASSEFLDRWAAGDVGWDDGRAADEVTIEGPERAWPRWLAATGYLLSVDP